MAEGDAAQVLIGDDGRMVKRIEQDSVGGLLANPGEGEQLLTCYRGRDRREPLERTLMHEIKKRYEGFD